MSTKFNKDAYKEISEMKDKPARVLEVDIRKM